jgi:hypothetical protein
MFEEDAMIPISKTMRIPVFMVALVVIAATNFTGGVTPSQMATPQDVAKALGITRPTGMTPTEASLAVARAVQSSINKSGPVPDSIGLPSNTLANAPFSAAVMTTVAGPFNQVSLMGNWNGKEDLVADHEGKVDDFSLKIPTGTQGFVLTRAAVSEHTIANGFNENIFYYGDSLGNVYVASSTKLAAAPASMTTLNLPTMMNAFGTLNSDDQVVVTGLCVSPVADLTSFSNVNGSFASYAGKIGEILYVTFWDTGSGLRLLSGGVPARSGLLAFPIADVTSPAPAPPGVVSPTGFPVTVGGSFGVAFSTFDNIAGCAVDDDGSVYFQQVDLVRFTGANIVKATPVGSNITRSLATSGFANMTTLFPANGDYGMSSGPAAQVNHFTNYSGTSTTFGNIAALASGPANTLYAAVARSLVPSDDPATQATEGLFSNPTALGPTPSMIISFADYMPPAAGQFPAPNGFADVEAPGLVLNPGVNNFRVFVLGTGPDPRGTSVVFGNSGNTQRIDFQVDYTVFSGLTVDEERKVYVVSGGTPADVGRNPSPTLGEILVFPDNSPADRRADYIDLRPTGSVPKGGISSSNLGDGISDRYDHIFWQAPLDQLSLTPAGVAGLARGFLMYLNRTRTNNILSFANLPNGAAQGDDATSGPVNFNDFDPSHQVAGGDIVAFPQVSGTTTQVNVDYEFLYGAIAAGPTCTSPQTNFFLNSNGSVTFGAGDTTPVPTTSGYLAGAGRIAGAWTDLNPASRSGGALNTFPVQAMGFAGINNFKVRWINVPQKGQEASGSSNTFSISMFDDGTGVYQSAPAGATPPVQKGPTALRWLAGAGGNLFGQPPRPAGSAYINLEYGRVDLTGSQFTPVIAGYTAGTQAANAPGATDLSEAGRTASLGTGVEANIFEFFNASNYDLRFEGSDARLSTPTTQTDLNREFLSFQGESCQSIGKNATSTAVSVSLNPAIVGHPVTITATVVNQNPSGPTPTGSVVFSTGPTVALNGAGTASVTTTLLSPGLYVVSANYIGNSTFAASNSQGLQLNAITEAVADFDGNGITDKTVFRPSNGDWFVLFSDGSGFLMQQWGDPGDVPVPGHYTGSSKADIAVWRPFSGMWFVIPSSNPGAPIVQQWGANGDIPVPGDYDGDGKTDFAVWRPSSGMWFVIPSSNPSTVIMQPWGLSGDIPVPGDYDGDGKTDFAVWRPSSGMWFVIPSSNPGVPIDQQWGSTGDIPLTGDFDGDRKTDFAVWRPSNGNWYVMPSSAPGTFNVTQWGSNGDVPIPKPVGQ